MSVNNKRKYNAFKLTKMIPKFVQFKLRIFCAGRQVEEVTVNKDYIIQF